MKSTTQPKLSQSKSRERTDHLSPKKSTPPTLMSNPGLASTHKLSIIDCLIARKQRITQRPTTSTGQTTSKTPTRPKKSSRVEVTVNLVTRSVSSTKVVTSNLTEGSFPRQNSDSTSATIKNAEEKGTMKGILRKGVTTSRSERAVKLRIGDKIFCRREENLNGNPVLIKT